MQIQVFYSPPRLRGTWYGLVGVIWQDQESQELCSLKLLVERDQYTDETKLEQAPERVQKHLKEFLPKIFADFQAKVQDDWQWESPL